MMVHQISTPLSPLYIHSIMDWVLVTLYLVDVFLSQLRDGERKINECRRLLIQGKSTA